MDPARSSIQSNMENEVQLLSASLSDYEKERAVQRVRWRVEEVARLEVKLLLRHMDTHYSKLTHAGAKLLSGGKGEMLEGDCCNGFHTVANLVPYMERTAENIYPIFHRR